MTLLLARHAWDERRASLGGSLTALADSIAADLEAVLARPLYIPDEKAQLSREGGRCPRDGALLAFDPFEEHRHRCPECGGTFTGERHRGFWRYWYHLWLAERAVHGAVLFRLRGDARHGQLAASVLEGYADRYLGYPNRDNVLGPARVFFSTYLESIWLLQLCIALDALEGADATAYASLGRTVRERIVAPGSALVALYDEGMSNRQAWNVAARMAALRTLGRDDEIQRLVDAPHGLAWLIDNGCLADGTWYEGENYHMFAHRGLWYGVVVAEAAGAPLPPATVARFDAGFAAPFLTALPDMTLPSRRDSQYAISLRQPRFAETCELGLARRDDPRLRAVLATLYDAPPGVPAGDNGRGRSSADVERNLPPMRLQRSDLGWRSLLFADAADHAAGGEASGSVLMEGQGIAVFRRDAGRAYAALDYGHSGGGHGHPDRLDLLLVHGGTRWLDDMGTGSYVDRSLHWYRSTLAHNAPLVDGRSQRRRDGTLLAFEDRGAAGWVRAAVDGVADGVHLERTLVVMPDYILDELRWTATREVTIDLPLHAPVAPVPDSPWHEADLPGGAGLEDGFEFVTGTQRRRLEAGEVVELAPLPVHPTDAMRAFVATDGPSELWRGVAPAAPGRGMHRFHVVRAASPSGRIRTVWAWGGGVARVAFGAGTTRVERDREATETHGPGPDGWHIDLTAGAARSSIDLGGVRSVPDAGPAAPEPAAAAPGHAAASLPPARPAVDLPFATVLHEPHYRRSEESWEEAGRPTADVRITGDERHVRVDIRVRKPSPLLFVEADAENPLDNEPAEINADGVQLYVAAGGHEGGWTIVPDEASPRARARRVRGWDQLAVDASWERSDEGYTLTATVALPDAPPGSEVAVGVVVNETGPGRARRRGQLVLGGAPGEWIYLRGDRHERELLLPVRLLGADLMF